MNSLSRRTVGAASLLTAVISFTGLAGGVAQAAPAHATPAAVVDTVIDTVPIGDAVPVGASPRGVAITADGTRAYVTNQDAGTVSVIETATDTVVGEPVPVGAFPTAVAITPDGSRAYVANRNAGTVSVIETATNSVVGEPVPVGAFPTAVAITPDGSRAYV
ncbi:YncE family protein, partial [Rhodococcus erythropolis]|uniref:beta-propeller fold lactonase family protein n=1 Tax=Rhodococcus erythropolis TaxID=1833 RepID=UPI00294A622F|nr:YncE family protein [Rhodococcus erythropolis]